MGNLQDKGVVAIGADEDGLYLLNDNPESKELLEKIQEVRFTEQEINDYCEKIGNLCLTAHSDGRLLFDAVRIIRQLQGCQTTTKTEIVD